MRAARAADAAGQEGQTAGAEAQVRLTALVEGVGDGDGGDAEDRPAHRAPVEDAVGGGPLDGGGGPRRGAERRRVDVERPFDDRPVDERRADTGAEDHADPAERAVVRSRVLTAETDPAMPAEDDETQEPQQRDDVPLVQEAEVLGEQVVEPDDDDAGLLRRDEHQRADAEHRRRGDGEHRPVGGRFARGRCGRRRRRRFSHGCHSASSPAAARRHAGPGCRRASAGWRATAATRGGSRARRATAAAPPSRAAGPPRRRAG